MQKIKYKTFCCIKPHVQFPITLHTVRADRVSCPSNNGSKFEKTMIAIFLFQGETLDLLVYRKYKRKLKFNDTTSRTHYRNSNHQTHAIYCANLINWARAIQYFISHILKKFLNDATLVPLMK